MLELRVLGQFEVRMDGEPIAIPSRPAQSLLAYLAITAGTAHRRERLAGLLWPDAEEDSARGSLRQGLWRIRKALEKTLPAGTQYVLADDLTIAFNPGSAYWLDASVLEGRPDGVGSVETLKESIAVYRGELLPGFFDDWTLRERERLEGVFDRRMGALLDCLIDQRQWPAVLEWAERWIAVGHVARSCWPTLNAETEHGSQVCTSGVESCCSRSSARSRLSRRVSSSSGCLAANVCSRRPASRRRTQPLRARPTKTGSRHQASRRSRVCSSSTKLMPSASLGGRP